MLTSVVPMATYPSRGTRLPVLPPFLNELNCPDCGGPFLWEKASGRCSRCTKPAIIRGGVLPDFLSAPNHVTETILAWPEEFLSRIEALLLNVRSERPLPASDTHEMRQRGLVDDNGHLT